MILDSINQELLTLKEKKNYRSLPQLIHDGRDVTVDGRRMLNLSSNDYLGLANEVSLREAFLKTITPETFLPTSSSSRLLTGNFTAYQELEQQLATMFGAESALLFNSGYHANTGILPAVSDARTLILADKLVHASLIDGIRLSSAKCIRYRHHDLAQLRRCAEEQNCINDIDFLVGTFGKAAASAGAYIICRQTIREYLINKMRTFIFTTALPPVNIQWTAWVLKHFADFRSKREHLLQISRKLKEALTEKGYNCPSVSHIVPMVVGASEDTIRKAEELQRKGFYALPVRPPTVPEGTSRIRFSLTADITEKEIDTLIEIING